jgi:thiol-disulfide isomerase/thioredoxin
VRLAALVLAGALLAPGAALTPVNETAFPQMISAHKGRVVLVNFWATYCVPCRKEMPALVALAGRYKAKGFDLVTISADDPEQENQAKAFLDQNKVPAPVYVRRANSDDKFINSIDTKWTGALPASFLYDKSGKKAQAYFGEVDLKALEVAIQKLL